MGSRYSNVMLTIIAACLVFMCVQALHTRISTVQAAKSGLTMTQLNTQQGQPNLPGIVPVVVQIGGPFPLPVQVVNPVTIGGLTGSLDLSPSTNRPPQNVQSSFVARAGDTGK